MAPTSLDAFVDGIRRKHKMHSKVVPGFDPGNGNSQAKYLFVLEAPGPKACETGYVSFDNPDRTAENFKQQLQCAHIDRADIAIWNVVPWYLGNKDRTKIRSPHTDEIAEGVKLLKDLVLLLPRLEYIILVGTSARRAHIALSMSCNARILACHHPSPRGLNKTPGAADENVAVFRRMRIGIDGATAACRN